MKNQELQEQQIGIENCLTLRGASLQIKLCKNLDKIKKEIKIVQETTIFKEYEEKRIKLAEKFANKDKENKPKMMPIIIKGQKIGEQYDITDLDKFTKEREALEIKTGYKELMETEVLIKLWRIKESELPNDMDGNQLNGIFKLIDFEEKE